MDWQADDETRALSWSALDVELSTVFGNDDRPRDGEPLAGTFADGLGGEERIEDLVEMLRGNAAAVVGNAHFDDVLPGTRAHGDEAAGFEGFSSFIDRVRGVDDEVEKDLVQLADAADDRW